MIVTCEKCGRRYDDENYLTYCPHDGIDGVCRRHDLFNCKFCAEEKRQAEDVRAATGEMVMTPVSGAWGGGQKTGAAKTDDKPELKAVEAHQGEPVEGEVHAQGPIHGVKKAGPIEPEKGEELPKAVEAHQGDALDGEVNAQGPIHGKK